MPLYNRDIIDQIGDARRTAARASRTIGSTDVVTGMAVANLTLTPSVDHIEGTGEDVGVVAIDFDPPATTLTDRIRDYRITWQVAGSPIVRQFTPGPPPITYYGLPLGKQITICVTPRTVNDAFGDEVCGIVTIPFDNIGPPQPSTGTVTPVLQGVEYEWDGLDIDGLAMPDDFATLIIYSGPSSTFDPDTEGTRVGDIGREGGTRFIWAYDTTSTIWLRAVAFDRYNNPSPPSTAQGAIPLESTVNIEPGSIGYDEIAFKQADNLIPDGSFENAIYRDRLDALPNVNFTQGGAFHGDWHMSISSGGATREAPLLEGVGVGPGNRCLQIGPHEKFLIRTNYYTTGGANGTARVRLICYDSAETVLPEPTWYTLDDEDIEQPTTMLPTVPEAWNDASGFFVAPAGTVFVEPRATVESSSTVGTWHFDAVEFRRVIQTAIIDDAAITNAKIKSLSVEKVDSGEVTADFVVARGSVRTVPMGEDGKQVGPVLDQYGFHQYDINGNPLIDFPVSASDSNPNIINSTIEARRFQTTIDGSFVLLGTNNRVGVNGGLLLADKVSDPTAQPISTIDWEYIQQTKPASTDFVYGLCKAPNDRWFMTVYRTAGVNASYIRQFGETGAHIDSVDLSDAYGPQGIVFGRHEYSPGVFSDRFYILQENWDNDRIYLEVRDATDPGASTFIKRTDIDYLGAGGLSTIGWDHTNNRPIIAWHRNDGGINVRALNTAFDGTVTEDVGARWNTPSGYTIPDWGMLQFAARGSFDFGADRYIFRGAVMGGSKAPFHVFTTVTPGVRQTNEEWPLAFSQDIDGAWWDGTSFYSVSGSGRRAKYEGGNKWTTQSSTWWGSYSLYDADASSPNGTHESAYSPRVQIDMPKRGRLMLTGPAPPDFGGVDDPNEVRFYLARGATDPLAASHYLQGSFVPDPANPSAPSSIIITNAVFTGTNPKIATTFASAGTPGFVKSQALDPSSNPKLDLRGNGFARFWNIAIDGDKDATKDAANVPPLRIGPAAGNHMRIDGNEIISMSSDSATGTLFLNKDGGNIRLGAGRAITGIDYGRIVVTTAAGGEAWIPHQLGVVPIAVFLTPASHYSDAWFPMWKDAESTATNIRVVLLDNATSGVVASASRTVAWFAVA